MNHNVSGMLKSVLGGAIIFLLGVGLTIPTTASAAPTIQTGQSANSHWWHTASVTATMQPEALALAGQGRTLFWASKKTAMIRIPEMVIRPLSHNTLIIVDRYANQVRVMVLKGKASVVADGGQYILIPSLQLMMLPVSGGQGSFIFDGVYRRPVLFNDTTTSHKLIVRQFYLEQLVHIDPLLRYVYQQNAQGKRLIEQLNKTSATLRTMNGIDGYAPQQM